MTLYKQIMKKLNRREFIGQSTISLGAVLAFSQLPLGLKASGTAAYKHPVGFQTFPIRDILSKDFSGTMKMMADIGYQTTRNVLSCRIYERRLWAALASLKATDIRRMIEDSGLHCYSCHFGIGDLSDNLDKSVDFAHELGLKQIVCPGLDVPGTKISEYKEAADKFNKIAEKIKSAGMQTGLHNHNGEFKMLDGELIYDAIMGSLDGDLVKMQFQTEVINLGYKGPDYFNKYPGRFISAHLSDWTADKKQVPIGQGVIDWKEFLPLLKQGE